MIMRLLSRATCSGVILVVAVGCGLTSTAPAASAPAPSLAAGTPAEISSAATPTPVSATPGETVLEYRRPAKPPIPVRLIGSVGSGSQLRQASPAERHKGELAIQGESDQSVVLLESREALLTWVGTVCERGYTILLEATGVIVTPDPRQGCDAGRVSYSCVLSTASELPTRFGLSLRRPVLWDG